MGYASKHTLEVNPPKPEMIENGRKLRAAAKLKVLRLDANSFDARAYGSRSYPYVMTGVRHDNGSYSINCQCPSSTHCKHIIGFLPMLDW